MFFDLALSLLQALHGVPVYVCLFLLVFSAGIGAPIAQDVLLLAAAGLTLQPVLQPLPLVAVAWLGIVAADALSVYLGHHYGARWIRRPWAARFVAQHRLPAMEAAMRRMAPAFTLVTRFLPGQRATLFFIAGTLRMPYRSFFIADALAALVHVALFVWGARVLGWDWRALQGRFERADDVLTAVLVVVLALLWLRWTWSRRSSSR